MGRQDYKQKLFVKKAVNVNERNEWELGFCFEYEWWSVQYSYSQTME